MYVLGKIRKCRETDAGTDILLSVPEKLAMPIEQKRITHAEIRIDDGRHISSEQRKKAYATIRDIAGYTGYLPEEAKEALKYYHIEKTGCKYFSLSDCTMDTAREFINTILDFALENGVMLSDSGLDRTDDIDRYLYACIKNRRCCICGLPADIHHVDAIGIGRNRHEIDDSDKRKMALCRKHHTIAHQMGRERFEQAFKVYGIIVKDVPLSEDGEEQTDGDQFTGQGETRGEGGSADPS